MGCAVGQSPPSPSGESWGNGRRLHGKRQQKVFLLFPPAIVEVEYLGGEVKIRTCHDEVYWWASASELQEGQQVCPGRLRDVGPERDTGGENFVEVWCVGMQGVVR